jgi:hypothetical protein
MHVHKAMVNLVGNDLRNGKIMLKQASALSAEQPAETWSRKND